MKKDTDEMIRKMFTLASGEVFVKIEGFKHRLESFKDTIKKTLPHFTLDEIVKIHNSLYEIQQLYKWSESEYFFDVLNYEKED